MREDGAEWQVREDGAEGQVREWDRGACEGGGGRHYNTVEVPSIILFQ